MKILSAYGVNELGMLYYAGAMPMMGKITLKDHINCQYEMAVHSVSEHGLHHGMNYPEKQFIFPFGKTRITVTL